MISPAAFCRAPDCDVPDIATSPPPQNLKNQARIRGLPPMPVAPLVAENGDVWPTRRDKMPTPMDLQKAAPHIDPANYMAHLQSAQHHHGGYGLCSGAHPPGANLGLCANKPTRQR